MAVHGLDDSAPYAVAASVCACAATASAECIVPFITLPGGKPDTAVPGETPRSPLTTLLPVLVTVDPASTANVLAMPSKHASDAGVPDTVTGVGGLLVPTGVVTVIVYVPGGVPIGTNTVS